MTDDWGVDSHTFDVHYRWNLSTGRYFQPHVRFYSQTAADFYGRCYSTVQPVPPFATADHRLGEFDGLTFGVKYGQRRAARRMVGAPRVVLSRPASRARRRVGALASLDLYPDLNASIAQFSYKFGRR